MKQTETRGNGIALTKKDKILLLTIARKGYIGEEERNEIQELLKTNSLALRVVSTRAELDELQRLDELRERLHIEFDTDVPIDCDPLYNEIEREIEQYRKELKLKYNK